ncbi:hypothetical protein [Pseudoalteromonas piratica]|uniref:DUF551 domain-containing protein n=1 Tax=Pseudoalteromonas piratica TaxID=1348114 RepID=A0A0A7EEW4_9GAMM|nr:hypothetical protein [Pseudoalteromonas piratica]AIY65210.1 hypothetical protein OM33_08580 [Pseudoalteromonas piratica]
MSEETNKAVSFERVRSSVPKNSVGILAYSTVLFHSRLGEIAISGSDRDTVCTAFNRLKTKSTTSCDPDRLQEVCFFKQDDLEDNNENFEQLNSTPWQPMETAPKNGDEVILYVEKRAGIPGGFLVGHYMGGGHCIEDHPPIDAGWYFWNGCQFDLASKPLAWMPLPKVPTGFKY